jgi:hypothetical protein
MEYGALLTQTYGLLSKYSGGVEQLTKGVLMNILHGTLLIFVIGLAVLMFYHLLLRPQNNEQMTKPSWLVQFGILLLGCFANERMKRMIVTASFTSKVSSKSHALDDTIIQKLEEVTQKLHVQSHVDGALYFPAVYCDMVWGGLNQDDLQQQSVDVDVVVRQIPKALRYGTLEQMKMDIMDILSITRPALA